MHMYIVGEGGGSVKRAAPMGCTEECFYRTVLSRRGRGDGSFWMNAQALAYDSTPNLLIDAHDCRLVT